MNNEQHAWKRIALVFLQISVTVRIDQILVAVGGQLVLFVVLEESLLDFAYQHGVLCFPFGADNQKSVLSPGVGSYDS